MTIADLIDKHWAACYVLALFTVFWTPLVCAAGASARAKRESRRES